MANADTSVLLNHLKIVPFIEFSFFVHFDLSHPPSVGSGLLANAPFLRQARPACCDLLPIVPGPFANALRADHKAGAERDHCA